MQALTTINLFRNVQVGVDTTTNDIHCFHKRASCQFNNLFMVHDAKVRLFRSEECEASLFEKS